MFSFKPIVFSMLLASANASLRATAPRDLSLEFIAGYEPRTSVVDHNAIAYDQEAIETALAGNSAAGFAVAKSVYEDGAFSKSYAEITLGGNGLPYDIEKGAKFSGPATVSGTTTGAAIKAYNMGDKVIQVQYTTSEKQSTYVNCQVGGNPDPNLDGCFAANGTIILEGSEQLTYSYTPATLNKNARTIQGFSTTANTRFRANDNINAPLFPDMQKFVNYYDTATFADQWIQAAFSGSSTNFQNGNANFGGYDFPGKIEAIQKATAYMSVGLYAIRELEDAIVDCERGCETEECNDDAVQSLDEAVAFYTGALEGTDGSGEGNLMYALADKRCVNFKTCGMNRDSFSGTSNVNIEIFRLFDDMKDNLAVKACAAAHVSKDRIAQLFFVPFIQGALRYAYITETEDSPTEKAEAEGAIFSAAVLPMVHFCSPGDAATIYDNLKTGQNGSADFNAVKKAFENNYDCLGLTCEDVGGLYNAARGTYEPGAEPCGSSGGSDNNAGLAVGLSIGGFVMVVLIAFFIRRRRSSGVEFKGEGGQVS